MVVAAITVFSLAPAAAEPIDVWLDVDPAIGMIERDVDDGVAMIQAFHSPELRVHGVTVNFGNAIMVWGYGVAREVVRLFGPEGLPVYPGASTADDLGVSSPAVDAMAEAFRERPMVLLALGPVTNAANLVQMHPEVHSNIEAIVMVAARRPGQEFRPRPNADVQFPDFNFESDPHAMQVLLNSDIPLVFAPWEVSSHVWITQPDLDALAAAGPSGDYIARKSVTWIRRWHEVSKTDGFNPFDTLAVGYVTHPELIEFADVSVRIDWRKGQVNAEGEPVVPHLIADFNAEGGRRAIYCYKPSDSFKPMLLERLAGSPPL